MFQCTFLTSLYLVTDFALILGQIDAPYDFATNTKGERPDELSPGKIAGISFGVVAIVAALLVTVLFCYYVRRKQAQESYSSGSSFLPQKPGY